MSAANKIKQAKALRQISVNQIKELKEMAETAKDDISQQTQFKMLYEHLGSIREEFKTQHVNLITNMAVQDQDIDAEEAVRKEFEYNCSYIYAIYATLFTSNDLKPSVSPHSSMTSKSNIRLPKIEIPKFDGDMKNFKGFIDMFNSLIHNNIDLTDVEKFNYLVASLVGPPLKLVQCTPVSADNYKTAYDAIIKRYDNKFLISMAHLQAIDNAPVANSKNSRTLRSVHDIFVENIAALKNLGFPVDEWDLILFYWLSKHIDSETMSRYQREEVFDSSDIPSFNNLKSFIFRTCNALDSLDMAQRTSPNFAKTNKVKYMSNNHNDNRTKLTSSLFSSNKVNCTFCKANHLIYKCPLFLNKNSRERFDFIKQNDNCLNCLSNLHTTNKCNSHSTCRKCQRRHHTLLHFEKPSQTASKEIEIKSTDPRIASDSDSAQISSSQSFYGIRSSSSNVLLSTALAEIKDGFGNFHKVRLILDTGSQSSYITRKCAQNLNLPRFNCNISIQGLGTMRDSTSCGVVTCTLRPMGKSETEINVDAIILPKLCTDIPTTLVDYSKWMHLSNIKLADPHFYKPSNVDILLGADVFPYILQSGTLKGESSAQPVALNTIFGWVLMGNTISNNFQEKQITSLYATAREDLFTLDDILKRFWEIEEIPSSNELQPDDERCEIIFQKTHSRLSSGRYVVELPFKNSDPLFDFNDTRSLAIRRFYALEKRLISQPEIYKQYESVIQQYLDDDLLEEVPRDSTFYSPNCFYIPHHCITKNNKFRIVYDASAKCSKGSSLNDELLTGPKLQKDIFSILLHFRTHEIAFTADIKGMFTQILVAEKHQNYQRIVWRFSSNDDVKDYRLKRVTFGLSSSPFLSNRVIIQLVQDEGSQFPHAQKILKEDIYVDDIVTGAPSLEKAKLYRDQLINLLKCGCFELGKWSSNCKELLDIFPESDRQSGCLELDFDSKSTLKILGLQWQPSSDIFSYKIEPLERPPTKRNILSEVARIYDMLGFLSPLVMFVKTLMQQLWALGLDWDDTPPASLCNLWTRFKSEVSYLKGLKIPRKLFPGQNYVCELHGFCDAALTGYAAVIYFRFERSSEYDTVLVAAKSKLAPLKTISIPRLELCAALLLSKLISQILKIFDNKIVFTKTFAWSDSSIALTWIKSPSYKYKTFVSNRISQIQDKVSPSLWHYVRSADNPADSASRGQFPSELLKNTLWWAGPSWLREPQDLWPSNSVDKEVSAEVKVEERNLNITLIASTNADNIIIMLLEKYSTLGKIVRIIAYMKRFISRCIEASKNSKNSKTTNFEYLSLHELDQALFIIVKHVQHSVFAEDIDNLKRNQLPSKPLRKLNAFLDDDEILRVGGRLVNSKLEYVQRHPAILPRNNLLTFRIINHYHEMFFHPGKQTLHYLILQKFWILSPKRAINKVISGCQNCWRLSPHTFQPPMGNLPELRISQLKPFSCVGIDYAGPFLIKMSKIRGAKTHKCYICIFVCFATKAIHIELASDLSSDAFLAAFRRFIARRGRCSAIYSDCGKNFVGAQKEIQNLIKGAAQTESIEWHFNPPYAPHFSGLAEAGVKSVKTHLRRVIGEQILTYEELYTLLTQIESLLNSRPLSPISADPNDISALTPGHFLTLEPLTSLPDPDLTHMKMNQLNRWQLLQRLHQHFWNRWHREYLHTLQQRAKWLDSSCRPEVGTLVLIKSDNLSPFKWPLGRITQLFYGDDGVPRVANVLTKTGILKRPLAKLAPLPLPIH